MTDGDETSASTSDSNWLAGVDPEASSQVTRASSPLTYSEGSQLSAEESEAELDRPTRRLPGSRIGDTIGRYQLLDEVGRGGMGVVYRALDPKLNRHVALKLIRKKFVQHKRSLGRFVDEAQVTAQLQHPAIVPIYDLGRTKEGDVFYTMGLVLGRTLRDIVREQEAGSEEPEGWSRYKLLQAFTSVCRAVAYAHERGVLHRDLKPENVMIGSFGQIQILDWGLAKVLNRLVEPIDLGPLEEAPILPRPGRTTTRVGTILGTPSYMAPEQVGGDSADVGPAADIFLLGGILYFMLTGSPPRGGSVGDVLNSLREGTPPPAPGSLREGVPADLEAVCLQALATAPGDRPASAQDLANAVQDYLEGRSRRAARPEDRAFLRSYSTAGFRRPSVTVDVAVLARGEQGWRALLLRRDRPPFAGCWALPGTFVPIEEDMEATARRALHTKLGLEAPDPLVQLGAYGQPERDPRTRVITVAYLALLDTAETPSSPDAAWFALRPGTAGATLQGEQGQGPPELAFDHARILADALQRLGPTGSGSGA